MTKRARNITIIAASLVLTFNAMAFSVYEKQDNNQNQVIMVAGENEEEIPIIY